MRWDGPEFDGCHEWSGDEREDYRGNSRERHNCISLAFDLEVEC